MVNGVVQYVTGEGYASFARVRVFGFSGQSIEYDAIIDTGFSGSVAILPEDVVTLGLLPSGSVETILADGSVRTVLTYSAPVEWYGVQIISEVIADDEVPLIGMEILTGYNLSVDVVDGGAVRITRLP